MVEYEPGQPVVDKENGKWLMLTSEAYGTAWKVEAEGMPISEFQSNEGYPDTDPVVDAVFPAELQSISHGDAPSVYTYPISRLKLFDLKNGIAKPQDSQECAYCGESYGPGSPYIETADGTEYCDVDCLNQSLQE